MNTEEKAKACEAPAFFIHANGDEMIDPSNAAKLHAAYGGANKTLKMCEGDHNSERPAAVIQEAI